MGQWVTGHYRSRMSGSNGSPFWTGHVGQFMLTRDPTPLFYQPSKSQ